MAKRTRITLTNAEAESPAGKQLIDLILSMCHDGQIEIKEVESLHIFLRRCESKIAAISYLRAITREIVADGNVDPSEVYRLKKAFVRVVPKEVRGVISTHLDSVGLPAVDPDEDEPAWTRHEASAKQIDYIVALGGTVTPNMTKGEASNLIETLLERRPPTPRQMMVIRFFDELQMASRTKEEVSEWLDSLYARDERYEHAWERFKRETSHDPFGTDPSIVPVGAFRRYVGVPGARASQAATAQPRKGVGCSAVLLLSVVALIVIALMR
ncbi:MAG: hypothetical protein IT434_15710 [Phycisphaerales bacterium]|jgi:hypothetical protein|nr:hypothetical protein [Phycisphaerales bacterium]